MLHAQLFISRWMRPMAQKFTPNGRMERTEHGVGMQRRFNKKLRESIGFKGATAGHHTIGFTPTTVLAVRLKRYGHMPKWAAIEPQKLRSRRCSQTLCRSGTPKPERLLQRIIEISTVAGDIVLNFFAGSGTTGAVAHKMNRRWIMVELGDHCHTHIIPRLKKVIDGEDKGGVTDAVEWQGGGGFRYFKLAPSLLQKDRHGREVISKAYNAEMLAEALCKLEGFTYAPSDSIYWQHGSSTEHDFIYVTTQTLSQEQLSHLSDEVGPDRSLLVLCSAFRGKASTYSNLTVKKIPNHVRTRCEWGHDDYSLNVGNLPKASPKTERAPADEPGTSGGAPKRQADLFGNVGGK